MINKHDDLVGSLVHDVAHLIRLHIDRSLKKHGLTRVKWLALGLLKARRSMSQTELARELELGDAPTGRLVDRLEERGLLVRQTDIKDRRVRVLTLSPKSKALLRELDGLPDELRKDILHDVAERDLEAIERGLARIKRNLRASVLASATLCVAGLRSLYFELSEAPLAIAQLI